MKIIIKDSDTNLNIRLPSRLVLNSITAVFAPRMINKKIKENTNDYKSLVTSSQLRKLIREINKYKRKHKDWILVEVNESSSGEKVIIKP